MIQLCLKREEGLTKQKSEKRSKERVKLREEDKAERTREKVSWRSSLEEAQKLC